MGFEPLDLSQDHVVLGLVQANVERATLAACATGRAWWAAWPTAGIETSANCVDVTLAPKPWRGTAVLASDKSIVCGRQRILDSESAKLQALWNGSPVPRAAGEGFYTGSRNRLSKRR